MTTHLTARITDIIYRRLLYDGIALVPAAEIGGKYSRPEFANSWCLPGRTLQTTKQLIALADSRGITVRLSETSLAGHMTARLN